MLEKKFAFLAPVEVVEVTKENLEEVAQWCGGVIGEAASTRVKGQMDPYVWVPTPPNTKLSNAFPGMFISKRLVRTYRNELQITYSVLKADYMKKNYFDTPIEAVDRTWGDHKTRVIQASHSNPKRAGKPKSHNEPKNPGQKKVWDGKKLVNETVQEAQEVLD